MISITTPSESNTPRMESNAIDKLLEKSEQYKINISGDAWKQVIVKILSQFSKINHLGV